MCTEADQMGRLSRVRFSAERLLDRIVSRSAAAAGRSGVTVVGRGGSDAAANTIPLITTAGPEAIRAGRLGVGCRSALVAFVGTRNRLSP